MPRGCLTVLEADGYAVEGLKHCVRPMDLAGAQITSDLKELSKDIANSKSYLLSLWACDVSTTD